MDLPFDWAAKESPSKLGETYLFLNDILVFVNGINGDGITFSTPSGTMHTFTDEDQVDSLKVWVPETGVYFKKGSDEAVFLQRRPLRQWRKSFSPSFYELNFIGGKVFKIFDIDTASRKSIWVDRFGVIRHYTKEIGYVKDSENIVCTVKHFRQELSDWTKGTIT